ncbi:MAG: protein translocase subunit SecD [Candidatus Nanopelagicales bacterium]|nr:protein translocase subunit SecD [Candidatus Nanopelagicales bacterium]
MSAANRARPGRLLILITLVLGATILWAFWPGASHEARLGLDLRGGTQVILTPELAPGTEGVLTQDQINQTVEIIRQRVNGFGVAEAEVTVQGSGANAAIVVTVPGVNPEGITNLLKQTARLDFRAVLAAGNGVEIAVPSASPSASPSVSPKAVVQPTELPIQAATSDELYEQYLSLNCFTPGLLQGGRADDPTKYMLTCSKDGFEKFVLAPAFITGDQVSDSQASLPQQGAGGWMVTLDFDSQGATKLSEASITLSKLPSPQNRFGIVLDGLVVSAPFFSEPILGGKAQIEGSFKAEEAKQLSQVLRYGALPVTLNIAESTSISPTLGQDQLSAGLLAGAIGLILVVIYLLIYYRALGFVAVFSLIVAAGFLWLLIIALGRSIGFTLTLAGIAGAIVAIGITADSFVVYFERIRDEIRDGKSLRVATELAWVRARRTLLAADFVSLLAAVVLYALSVGSVRGFAFTLGLTTVIDVLVAFWFTHPLVTYFGKSSWAETGGILTGVSRKRLIAGSTILNGSDK